MMHLNTLISALINVLCWTYKLINMINFNYEKKKHMTWLNLSFNVGFNTNKEPGAPVVSSLFII